MTPETREIADLREHQHGYRGVTRSALKGALDETRAYTLAGLERPDVRE